MMGIKFKQSLNPTEANLSHTYLLSYDLLVNW